MKLGSCRAKNIEPLQQSLSCFTNLVLRPSGYDVGPLLAVTLTAPTAYLVTYNDEVLHLSFVQTFSIVSGMLGGYKVRTHSYYYAVEDEDTHEIIAFHWHPESEVSPIKFPHFHIREGAASELRDEFYHMHIRTDRMAFEDFGLMLLGDFSVIPERGDAVEVLQRNLKKFNRHKTWR